MSEAGGMKVFEGVCVHVDVLMVENMFFFTRGFVDDFWFGNSLQSNNNAIHAELKAGILVGQNLVQGATLWGRNWLVEL